MKKLLMIILDGFGIREEKHGNAIKMAKMDFFDRLWSEYPHSILEASGEAVGLPEGIFGNSEINHEVIGAGKKIEHRLTIAINEIMSRKIVDNPVLKSLVRHVLQSDSTLHLMGLLSDGGVHSHKTYILKLIPILKEMGVRKIVFHVITDGRDTHHMSALNYIKELEKVLNETNIGYIATVCGRYYAMDRDRNYERTEIYHNLTIDGKGLNILNLDVAIQSCYGKRIMDEHLPPLIVNSEGKVEEHDALLWLNFRSDRTNQIINAITDPEFNYFERKEINNLKVATLFAQENVKHAEYLFEKSTEDIYPFGEYLSDLEFTQARISESEKYSHVTKFFNVQKETKYKGTENILIPSPEVATFDKAPLMSAPEVANQTIKALENDYDFILVNFANPDMLGHTGDLDATITALEALDVLLEEVIAAAEDNFYKVVILSDHGNADTMLREDGSPVTTHSLSPVPFILLDKNIKLKDKGDLTMVAPTLLKYLDIAIPKEMRETENLIVDDKV